jgi:hypothetical protein
MGEDIERSPLLVEMHRALVSARDKMAEAISQGVIVGDELRIPRPGGRAGQADGQRAGKSPGPKKPASPAPAETSQVPGQPGGQRVAKTSQVPGLPAADPASMSEEDRAALLGTMPDSRLGTLWGVSHTWIAKMRKARGIAPYSAKPRVDWTYWDPILMASMDADVESLSEQIGCDPSTVSQRRRALLGEPSKYQSGRPPKGQGPDWSSVDWSLPDREIASRLRVNQSAVYKRRQKLKAAGEGKAPQS